jgi:phosphate:Na+ symporter
MANILEKLTIKIIPDDKKPEFVEELDERLLATPPIALERSRMLCADMANAAMEALEKGLSCLKDYTPELADEVRKLEDRTDHYEDILGSYLVKLSTQAANEADSLEAAGLLKVIGDFERITDHAVNLVESAEELISKELAFSDSAKEELAVIGAAVNEVVSLARDAFINGDLAVADKVEPLEEVVDDLKDTLRSRHIRRLQKGQCSIEVGFVWSDLLTGLERISDHCSNIAVCILDMANHNMNQHEAVRLMHKDTDHFNNIYKLYSEKYTLCEE